MCRESKREEDGSQRGGAFKESRDSKGLGSVVLFSLRKQGSLNAFDNILTFAGNIHRLESSVPYYVYILTNFKKTVLYIGFTGNLEERITQHKSGQVEGFTKRYNVNSLIYFEEFDDINDAKARERALKAWKRAWKEELINASNPEWDEVVIV